MKKKNLVAMGLAGVMLVGGCVPVLAAEESTQNVDSPTSSGTADVTLKLSEKYSLTIPKTIEVDSTTKTATLKFVAKSTFLSKDNKLKITVEAEDVVLKLGGTDELHKQEMTFGKTELASFENGLQAEESQSVTLSEKNDGSSADVAGAYSNTVQFNIITEPVAASN